MSEAAFHELKLGERRVGAALRIANALAARSHAQHASARRLVPIALAPRASVEDDDARVGLGVG